MTLEEFYFVDEYEEALPEDMNTGGGHVRAHTHSHAAGISSGSSSSSSTVSSSFGGDGHAYGYQSHDAHMHTDPVCAALYNTHYIEDIVYLLKVIIELYELDELKPLFKKMSMNFLAHKSMYRHRYVKPKEKEKHLDDELFKI